MDVFGQILLKRCLFWSFDGCLTSYDRVDFCCYHFMAGEGEKGKGRWGERTRTELGNDAVYKLSFDGVNNKIGRASDGVSVWQYSDIWFFCIKCESIKPLLLNNAKRESSGPE